MDYLYLMLKNHIKRVVELDNDNVIKIYATI